jgi:transcriptional regulator with XRE-family HTH domain
MQGLLLFEFRTVDQDRYDKFLKEVGMNVRRIRKDRGLTMEDVAHEANMEYRQLGRIERGEVSATITSFLRLADVMKAQVHEFFILTPVKKQK